MLVSAPAGMARMHLISLLDELSKADFEPMSCQEALVWLAKAVRVHWEADVVRIRLVDCAPDKMAIAADWPVVSADDPPVFGSPIVFSQLVVPGQETRLPGAGEVDHRVIDGPVEILGTMLRADEQCLSLRLRLDTAACWVVMIKKRDSGWQCSDEDCAKAVCALLRIVIRRLDEHNLDTARGRRLLFYNELRFSSGPEADFPYLCKAWQAVSGADWTWLWLYNRFTDQFELSACSAKDGSDVIPQERMTPASDSVAAYCVKTRKPVRVADMRAWRGQWEGREFRAVCADSLERMGCSCFDCIPVLAPTSDPMGKDRFQEVAGVMCLHYKNAASRWPQPQSSLLLMGRLTTLAIVNSYLAEQRAMLVQLNDLAQRHLTTVSRRPGEVRSQYLRELIELIRSRLHVEAVSIFYRTPFGESVQCLASTGLCRADGQRIPDSKLADAVYLSNERETGKCFATGEPKFFAYDAAPAEGGAYVEISPDGQKVQPAVLYPIPISQDGTPHTRAAGVIRCSHHMAPLFKEHTRSVDPTEVQKLDFIARQIGPVLQTFETKVLREQTISIIKHDLFAPLSMIRDTAAKIQRDMDRGQSVNPYDVKDLSVSHVLAQSLVAQLDPDPTEVREFNPVRTFLEGDIVARLSNMLGHYAKETKDMEIHFNGFRDIPPLRIDPVLVERALWNLLMNAIKYGKRGSRIEVEARRTGAGFHVDVSNHGLGVEPQEIPHLFKPNYRSPRAMIMQQGLGLGLSIARHIMEKHGGRAELTAAKDPTVFSLFFPESVLWR